MKPLSPHLAWWEDTCSVYCVQDGDAALLIDCGTDSPPAALPAPVERLLLTHFHRDQCAAAHAWQRAGAKVTIPFAERRFFEEADLSRAAYDITDNYTAYYPGFGPLRDLRPDFYARDDERLTWRDISFEVVPLPGHTFGSVGYLFEVDGRRVLACGDILSGPGKARDYYWTQWKYMDFTGHGNWLDSLKRIGEMGVNLILPGHGEPFVPTPDALGDLQRRLERLYELFYGRPYVYFTPVFRALTPHVIEVSNSGANTYIVKDDAGHALFIDCGYTATHAIAANPHRFIDHLTPHLEPQLGIQHVEWFIPSHYHDDHLAGYPALKNRYGTRVMSSPELKDILEHPERYDMPCLVPEGFPVDRVVSRVEVADWRGIAFRIEQQPGQTLYHHLIHFEVDGTKFLCVGDNLSGISLKEGRAYVHSFIPKNRTPVSSYTDMPRQILHAAPDVLLTGHLGGLPFDRGLAEGWQRWMAEWQQLFTDIIDQPHPNLGMDPRWVEFYPYKVRVRPGETVRFHLWVTNHEAEARSCAVRFRSVDGVTIQPTEMAFDVPAGEVAERVVIVTYPAAFRTHSLPVLADVTWHGRRLGEVAEAIATW